ncbi:DUF4304 domain-containing protein, partial [Parasediminibacterium paludis]
ERVIKEGFHEVLKPLGYKKKGNNFFIQLAELGQIINIQKSSLSSKDHIKFTINTGLFIPEFWLAFYNFHDREIPIFPTEPECLVRQRIGELKNQSDTWFDIDNNSIAEDLIIEMKSSLKNHILPYFDTFNSKEKILVGLDNNTLKTERLGKLIVYGEYKQIDKAQIEYEKIISKKGINPSFMLTI